MEKIENNVSLDCVVAQTTQSSMRDGMKAALLGTLITGYLLGVNLWAFAATGVEYKLGRSKEDCAVLHMMNLGINEPGYRAGHRYFYNDQDFVQTALAQFNRR